MNVERATEILARVACAAGAGLVGLLGGWDAPLRALVILMAVDYVAGFLVGFSGKSPKSPGGGLSSAVGWRGLLKKAMIILILIMAELLDLMIGIQAFRIAVVCFYAANEGLSILENAALLGVPLPKQLKRALEDLKERKIDIGVGRENKSD